MSRASDTRSRVAACLMYIKLNFNKGDNQKMHFPPSHSHSHPISMPILLSFAWKSSLPWGQAQATNCIYNLSWHLIAPDFWFCFPCHLLVSFFAPLYAYYNKLCCRHLIDKNRKLILITMREFYGIILISVCNIEKSWLKTSSKKDISYGNTLHLLFLSKTNMIY